MCVCAVLSHSVVSDSLRPHQASLSMRTFQAKTLEWLAMPSSRASLQPRGWTQVSHSTGNSLPSEPSGKLRERYKHLNAEFQRIARRDKKAFLSDQCKEIEENNRMGKTRHLFKKIRDTKGLFHAKMGSIKDRNNMDLTEAEELYQKKSQWPR